MIKLADDLMGHRGKMNDFIAQTLKEKAPERDAFFSQMATQPTYERK